MAVRSSMAYLITFVRELLNDPAGASQKFTDQEIQDRLDTGRLDLYLEPLKSADFMTSTGSIEWHDWFARKGFWETDYLMQKCSGPTVTPDTSDPLVGKFTFTDNQITPLIISGKVYNVYRIAGLLMTEWIAEIRAQIQMWSADGTTVQRIGQVAAMERLAAEYFKLAWGWGNQTSIKLVRKDLRN